MQRSVDTGPHILSSESDWYPVFRTLVPPVMIRKALPLIALVLVALQSGCGKRATACGAKSTAGLASATDRRSSFTTSDARSASAYSGTDERGVPHYFTGRLSDEARRLLRDAYGVISPSHLYISDSTKDGLLKYDTKAKSCRSCYVNSYRIGFISIRRKGESWDELERRTRTLTRSSFPATSLITSSSVSSMDPDVQGEVTQMLDAARRGGFDVHVVSTYRSPEQEALVMAQSRGRTHTLTSLHSYGRAIDVRIGDGNLSHSSTRRSWIAFRNWVTRFKGNDFRILGPPNRSWDWSHVELPNEKIGFGSIEAAITVGRVCLSDPSPRACEFPPHLPSSGVSGTRE